MLPFTPSEGAKILLCYIWAAKWYSHGCSELVFVLFLSPLMLLHHENQPSHTVPPGFCTEGFPGQDLTLKECVVPLALSQVPNIVELMLRAVLSSARVADVTV